MKLRSLILAAALAVAPMTGATAAPDYTLELTGGSDGIFFTGIASASDFWDAFEAVFSRDLYDAVEQSFLDVMGSFDVYDPQVFFSGGSWNGYLTFNSTQKRVDFTDQTGEFTRFISDSTLPVPGPEAGAGIGALAMAGVAYVAIRRRKQQLAA